MSKFIASEIKVNGKPIKKSYQNALIKAQKTYFWKDKNSGIRSNLFTGKAIQLNELEASIYDWIMTWYSLYEKGIMMKDTSVALFDNMRYLFLELNSSAYYDLID